MLKIVSPRTPGGNYRMRGTIEGRRIFESTGLSNRTEAQAYIGRQNTAHQQRRAHGKAATLTFGEAALPYIQAGGETRFLTRILQHAGSSTLLSEIDNAWLARAAEAIYPNAAPATINRQLITPVSAVCNMAAEEGLAVPRKFRRHKDDKPRTRWLTPEEAERLFTKAGSHLKPIIALLLGSGCRTSEALGAEAHFWYPATGEIWLPDTKNQHPRMLRLPTRSRDILLSADLPDVGPIFKTPQGKPYQLRENSGGQISKAFSNARTAARLGSDVTPHVLRHTWATWYYAATRDFGGLLDLGGWQKADMAQRYRKIAPADLPARLLDHGWDFPALNGPKSNQMPLGLRTLK